MQNLQKIKGYLIKSVILAVIIIYVFHYFTTTVDETGFLGMNTNGRQIFIQSMDHYMKTMDSSVTVSSEWDNYSLLERLWQEPMRTTLKMDKAMSEDDYLQFQIAGGFSETTRSKDVETSLETPYVDFVRNLSEISLSEDYSVSSEELETIANEAGVVTYRDLLRGFGFTSYEYYVNGELISSIILNPQITNHVQGNFISKVGSTENQSVAE